MGFRLSRRPTPVDNEVRAGPVRRAVPGKKRRRARVRAFERVLDQESTPRESGLSLVRHALSGTLEGLGTPGRPGEGNASRPAPADPVASFAGNGEVSPLPTR